MKPSDYLPVLSEFFKDGAKIVFGSAVVGVFAPNAPGGIPWLTFSVGVASTTIFLAVASRINAILSKIKL